MNINKNIFRYFMPALILGFTACNIQVKRLKEGNKNTPGSYYNPIANADSAYNPFDTLCSGNIKWKQFYTDTFLSQLIDTALVNNQELNIIQQEILISKNEIRARKGEYLPFVGVGGAAGAEKTARYTRNGAVEANTQIKPGQNFPDPLPDFVGGFTASWEIDIWNKLHNAKKSAIHRYLASVEGRNFLVTQMVAEISNSYYELIALDNQEDILQKNIDILTNALDIVKQQKSAARVTELAVKKFEAELLKNKSSIYYVKQKIRETENHINCLTGRFPQPIKRNSSLFTAFTPPVIHTGLPSKMLLNRPDIRQAEQEMAAAKLDVNVARANFYPSLRITAATGTQAFNPALLASPQSILFMFAGDLAAPLINKNALKARLGNANAVQVQSVYMYEKNILNAFVEVSNQVSNISNLQKSFDMKSQQVKALTESISISYNLFRSARADYMEVLMTQRDGLEAKLELIETKKEQLIAGVNMYKALGGGWK